jgi:hypothetical protein
LTQAKPAGVSAKHGIHLANESLNFSYNLKTHEQLCPVWKNKCKKEKKINILFHDMHVELWLVLGCS